MGFEAEERINELLRRRGVGRGGGGELLAFLAKGRALGGYRELVSGDLHDVVHTVPVDGRSSPTRMVMALTGSADSTLCGS